MAISSNPSQRQGGCESEDEDVGAGDQVTGPPGIIIVYSNNVGIFVTYVFLEVDSIIHILCMSTFTV